MKLAFSLTPATDSGQILVGPTGTSRVADEAARATLDLPISSALDLVGDRWSLLIVRDAVMRGKVHYGEFLACDEGIATNIVAHRLALLEQGGPLVRSCREERSGRQSYLPTERPATCWRCSSP